MNKLEEIYSNSGYHIVKKKYTWIIMKNNNTRCIALITVDNNEFSSRSKGYNVTDYDKNTCHYYNSITECFNAVTKNNNEDLI